MRHAVEFGREVCGDFEIAERREWLVTNGIGGYACGTVAGSLARSYHGYLIAALAPPGGRTLVVAKCEEICVVAGVRRELGANRWRSGAIAPQGFLALERFYLDGTTPVWEYALDGVLLEKRVSLAPGANVALVRYRVLRAAEAVTLEVAILGDWRDHGATSDGTALPSTSVEDGAAVVRYGEGGAMYLRCDRAVPHADCRPYRDYALARESERGLPDVDAHVRVANVSFALAAGETAHLWCAVEDVRYADAAQPWRERAEGERDLLARARPSCVEHAQLVLAADQFVVAREVEGAPGTSVIAGYPWFTDWGRDTAISLPGLTLATGRPEIARAVLETFARFIDGGMLPNVFPDRGDVPEYNTVDAALWYVEAVRAYVEACGIDAAFDTLFDACAAIVAGYRRGTRYGIVMDPGDALIRAGEPGVQLTWMDAKYGDVVVTPRIGKPVEINALWYNALCTMAGFVRRRGMRDTEYGPLAARVRTSFARYAIAGRGLADVLDGPDGNDTSVRPNQIFAVSLEHSPVDAATAREIVDVCARTLLTSHGLRTLDPSDPRYAGRYGGTLPQRDGAYHQGTVWAWLLGPFACAHARAYDDVATARTLLAPLGGALGAYAAGTLGEIADGDEPFAWKGAFAQAWSVAETLRAYRHLE